MGHHSNAQAPGVRPERRIWLAAARRRAALAAPAGRAAAAAGNPVRVLPAGRRPALQARAAPASARQPSASGLAGASWNRVGHFQG